MSHSYTEKWSSAAAFSVPLGRAGLGAGTYSTDTPVVIFVEDEEDEEEEPRLLEESSLEGGGGV